MSKKKVFRCTSFTALALTSCAAWAQATPPAVVQNSAATDGATSGYDDIIVTARRREESLQSVPVSVTAFSGAALQARSVFTMSDLSNITPGLRFTSEGGKDTTSVSLRGLAQVPLGDTIPAVVTYFANVPLAISGSNFPTYDIGSIQVLKGPQGTLFGRNTLGGAILVQPEAPSNEFGGYVKGTYARYNYRAIEGAINLPIIADKVALRVAGQIRRQDGRIENLSGGADFDNVHQDSFRASLLLTPTEGLRNLTIFDWFRSDERSGGGYLLRVNEGAIPGLSDFLDPQLLAYRAGQRSNFFGAYDNGANGFTKRKIYGITNDTSLEMGDLTLRNIFGYRRVTADAKINSSGAGTLTLPGFFFGSPAPAVPFTLFNGAALISREYYTNETQLLGSFDRFNFILGTFFNSDRDVGPGGSSFQAFAPSTTPPTFVTSHIANRNFAVFGQVGYKLTDKLTANIGGRYTWDRVSTCGGSFGAQYVDTKACKQTAGLNLVDGIGTARAKGQEPSWTLGLDYQASSDLLVYAASRRGYRGVSLNTPTFESPFTTGGAGCSLGTASVACPDLRPFQSTKEEKLTDFEVGTKWDFRLGEGRGRLNIAGFYTKYKNGLQFLNVQTLGLPATTPDTPNNGSIGINVADQSIYGIEFDGFVRPVPSLTISFNGAYTHQKIDRITAPTSVGLPPITAAQITLPAPSFSGNVAASWTLPFKPLDGDVVLTGDVYMTDDFGGQGGENLPGYTLSNFRIDWKNISDTGIDLGAFVRNAFNEKYLAAPIVLLKSFPTSAGYVGEQRIWGVEARVRF